MKFRQILSSSRSSQKSISKFYSKDRTLVDTKIKQTTIPPHPKIHAVIHMSSGDKMTLFLGFRDGFDLPYDFFPRLHLTKLFYSPKLS